MEVLGFQTRLAEGSLQPLLEDGSWNALIGAKKLSNQKERAWPWHVDPNLKLMDIMAMVWISSNQLVQWDGILASG